MKTRTKNLYEITTDDGKTVDVSKMNPRSTIRIGGRQVLVKDIPITTGTLNCGHIIRGIGIQKRDIVECPQHDGYRQATVV